MKYENIPLEVVLCADSWEVQRQYYLDRICMLEEEISKLNLQEHCREITLFCSQITEIKKLMKHRFRNL